MNFTNNKLYNDISICCADAGRSYVTYFMLKSLLRFNITFPIYIICNTDNEYLYLLKELSERYSNIHLIENFNYHLLNETISPIDISFLHIKSINYLLQNYVKTNYVLIMDNDIIFKDQFTEYLETILNLNDSYMYAFLTSEGAHDDDGYKEWILSMSHSEKLTTENYGNSVVTTKTHTIFNDYLYLGHRFLPFLYFFNYTKLKEIIPDFSTIFTTVQFETIGEMYYSRDTLSIFTEYCINNNINMLTKHGEQIYNYIVHYFCASHREVLTYDCYKQFVIETYKKLNYNDDKINQLI